MFCDDYYVWTTALEDQDQARQFCNDEIGVDEIQGKWNEERVLAYIMMHGDPKHVEKALSIVDAEDDLLGFACRYNTVEVVEVMVKNGMKFIHEGEYATESALVYGIISYHCQVELYKHDGVNGNQERKKILDLLMGCQKETDFQPSRLLLEAILAVDKYMVDLLESYGVAVDPESQFYGGDAVDSMTSDQLAEIIGMLSSKRKGYVLEKLGKQGNLTLRRKMISNYDLYRNVNLLRGILHCKKGKDVDKKLIFEALIEARDMDLLNMPQLKNWIQNYKDVETFEQMVVEMADPMIKAWFMDFKERNFDVRAMEEKKEKTMMQKIVASPDSKTFLSMFFSFKKIEGGYMITSYKGEDTQVVVPGFVAGLPVKVLGEFSFSAIQPYIKYEIKKRRAKIESVVISEGVEVIEKDCFRNTERITTLVLPHSLKEFKAEVPYLVKTLVIPENVIEVWVYDVYKRYLTELTFLGPTKIKDLYEDYLYPSYSELKVVKGLPNSDAAILAKRTKATFIPLDGK